MNLVSIGAIVYGLYLSYMGYTGSIVVDNNFWIQAAGSILGGVGFLGYNHKDKVMEVVKNLTGKISLPTGEVEKVDINKDIAAIHHLMGRAVDLKSEQGIKLCKELNSVLFEMQYDLHAK